MSDEEDGQDEVDLSIIQKAIEISGNVIEQILKGIHYGSPEVRCLLYSECDYILECKVCRGLFRSLANFVAHKRAYCKLAFQQSDTFMNLICPDEETVIVHPEAPEDTIKSKKRPRTLENTIQQLKDGTLGHSNTYKLYSQAADKLEQQRESKQLQTLTFEAIPNTTMAMKVTVSEGHPTEKEVTSDDTEAPGNSSGTQLQSSPTATLKSMLLKSALEGDNSVSTTQKLSQCAQRNQNGKANRNTVLSPPKKMTLRCKDGLNGMPWKKARKEEKESVSPESHMDFNSLECLVCNTAFRSKKTLIFHYQNAHLGKRTFFPCPSCDRVFFYIFGLTRHLMRFHNKSKTQVDKMREKLKKNSFVKEVTSQCQSARQQILHVKEEVSRSGVKKSSRIKSNPMKADVNDVIQSAFYSSPSKEDIDHICSNCDRSFGKKISLLNHRKICLTQGCTPISMTTTIAKHKLETPVSISLATSIGRTETVSSARGAFENNKMNISPPPIVTTKDRNKSLSPVTLTTNVRKDNLQSLPEMKPIKKPLTKTTSMSSNRRFTARTANPRRDIIQSGFSSSVEEDKMDMDYIKPDGIKMSLGKELMPRNRNGLFSTVQKLTKEKISEERNNENKDVEIEMKVNTDENNISLNHDNKKEPECVEEIWVEKQPGRPTEKIKSNRTYVMKMSAYQRLECQDTKRVQEIVNENELQCIHCDQEFSNVSNLRRHAIRHLGWKRYKCKMCKFSSYNKSECNTHLFRTHSDRFRNVSSVNSLIVDLGKEGSRARMRKKQATLMEKQLAEVGFGVKCYVQGKGIKRFQKEIPEEAKDLPPVKRNTKEEKATKVTPFNISTRNSPREFDIRPYRKVDRMSSLCTRKSSYPKKITQNSICQDESDDDSKSSISQASISSKLNKSNAISMFSETSAKAKVDDSMMDVSDSISDVFIVNKFKTGKGVMPCDSPSTRRSVRSVIDPGKTNVKTELTSDLSELKAARNITQDLLEHAQ